MADGFDFPGLRIQWKRKRGTRKWYVYTFIADRPFRAVKAKICTLTHRVSQADMGAVIGRINQILCGWTNYFRHAVCKHTLNRLRYFLNWRWLRNATVGAGRRCAASSPPRPGGGLRLQPTG
jgi:RNA-directed DNA polymerase